MRITSWNVNGLRAVQRKGALDQLVDAGPDILCLQETRCDLVAEAAAYEDLQERYGGVRFSTGSQGRSGTAICSDWNRWRTTSAPQRNGALYDDETGEGRVTSEIVGDFTLLTVYAPNTGREHRHREKHDWLVRLLGEVKWLQQSLPVVLCGDWNAILEPLDVHDYEGTLETAGNHAFEREDLYDLLASARLVDVWRLRNPSRRQYTYWDYRGNMRRRGLGWRIDSFLVDERLVDRITNATIDDHITGSDHCPVSITISEIA